VGSVAEEEAAAEASAEAVADALGAVAAVEAGGLVVEAVAVGARAANPAGRLSERIHDEGRFRDVPRFAFVGKG
jgi:hypothetical protein